MNNPRKVAIAFAAVATLVYCTALGAVSVLRESELFEHLEVAVESDMRFRVAQIEAYRDSVAGDLRLVADAELTGESIGDFSRAFDALGVDATETAQRLYITNNPHPAAARDALMRAGGGAVYNRVHAIYHSWFRAVKANRDYQDLLLIRPDGTVIYSVMKQGDFATNLRSGIFPASPLAQLAEDLLKARPNTVLSTYFAPYRPNGNRPVSFAGAPIYAEGLIAGAVVVALRLDPFQRTVRVLETQMKGIDAYVVAADGTNLTRPGAEISELARLALGGAAGTRTTQGASGHEVFAAFAPVRWIDRQWAVVVELDMTAANRRKWAGVPILTALGGILVGLALVAGWLLGAHEEPIER